MEQTAAVFAGLSLVSLAYAVLVVFVAAVVRGYAGFGSSALIVTYLPLVPPPAEVVPIATFLEIVASIGLMTQVWKDVAWRTIGWLLVGAALGMPISFAVLAAYPADLLRVGISLLVRQLVSAFSVSSDSSLKTPEFLSLCQRSYRRGRSPSPERLTMTEPVFV